MAPTGPVSRMLASHSVAMKVCDARARACACRMHALGGVDRSVHVCLCTRFFGRWSSLLLFFECHDVLTPDTRIISMSSLFLVASVHE